jgi:hypothetical protein
MICSECIHAAFNSSGVYCTLFHEAIWNERVAEDCGEYQPEPPVLTVVPPEYEQLQFPGVDWGSYERGSAG